YHVQHRGQGRRVALRVSAFPSVQTEHDEDREPPQQTQSLGILFLRRLRRTRRGSQGGAGAEPVAYTVQLREGPGILPERRVTTRSHAAARIWSCRWMSL